MKELFGLKDENGKDVKVIIDEDYYKHPHSTLRFERIKPVGPMPEWKIPGWYVWTEPVMGEWIFRAIKVEINDLIADDGVWHTKKLCRPAFSAEIEAHLRKICKEKGYKEGVRIKNIENGEIHTIDDRNWTYWFDSDSLHVSTPKKEWFGEGREHTNPAIYKQGRWAEIIFNKKPVESEFKLPGWYVWANIAMELSRVFWATKEGKDELSADDEVWHSKTFCHPATPIEIEVHLKKICKEKGYKEGVRIKNIENGEIHTIDDQDWRYSHNSDSLHVYTSKKEWQGAFKGRKHSNPAIYKQGRWAEIIFNKKPLPKTKEEFKSFFSEWSNKYGLHDFYKFLDQYED